MNTELNRFIEGFKDYLIDKLKYVYWDDGIVFIHTSEFRESIDSGTCFMSALLKANSYLLNIERATMKISISKNNIVLSLFNGNEYNLTILDSDIGYSYDELFNKYFTVLYYCRREHIK